MTIASVVCLCLAALIGGTGLWTLTRRAGATDLTGQVVRSVAPAQLAAAVMLGAGAVVGLVAPTRIGLIGVIAGVLGAFGTLAAASWQAARYAERRSQSGGCGSGGCGGCAQVCAPSETGNGPAG